MLGRDRRLHLLFVLLRAAFNGSGQLIHQQAHALQSVVVAGDHDVHILRVAIRIEDTDYCHAHLARFAHGVGFTGGVNHDHHRGDALHIANTAKVTGDLALLASHEGELLLVELLVCDRLLVNGLELLETLESGTDHREIRQGAADPALGHNGHTRALASFDDYAFDLALGANPKNHFAFRGNLEKQVLRANDAPQGFAQIDHVDRPILTMNVRLHARVPAGCAAAVVHAGVDQGLNGGNLHGGLITWVCG